MLDRVWLDDAVDGGGRCGGEGFGGALEGFKEELCGVLCAEVRRMVEGACEGIKKRFEGLVESVKEDLVVNEEGKDLMGVFISVLKERDDTGLNEKTEKLINSLGYAESTMEVKKKDLQKAVSILSALKSASLKSLSTRISLKISENLSQIIDTQISTSILGSEDKNTPLKLNHIKLTDNTPIDLDKVKLPAHYKQKHSQMLKKLQSLTDNDIQLIGKCSSLLVQKSSLGFSATLARIARMTVPQQTALHYENLVTVLSGIYLISPTTISDELKASISWSMQGDRLAAIVK